MRIVSGRIASCQGGLHADVKIAPPEHMMSRDAGRPARLTGWLLGGLVLIAAAVRIWGLDFGLPHTEARPDETFIIGLSLAMLSGAPPPPYYDYPWFFVWMSMAAYLGYYVWGVAAGSFTTLAEMAASYEMYWAPFFLLNRGLSAAFGTGSVLVVYAIGRRLRDRTTGITAALFLALAHIHSQNSHFGTTDVVMTFFIMLSVALILRAHATERPWDFVAAGVAGGIAAATKYNAVVLALPMVLSQVLLLIDAPSGRRLKAVRDTRTLLLGVPCLLAFLTGIPFVFYDYEGFRVAMDLLAGSMATGSPELGLDSGWAHHFKLSLRHGIGMPLLAAGLGGAVLLLVRDVRRGVLFLAFPMVYYVIAGQSLNQFFRYVLPVVPFLCVTAGLLVAEVASGVGRTVPLLPARARPAAVAALLSAVVVAPSAWNVWQFDRVMARDDNRVVVAEWVAQYVPPGESIVQSGSHYGHAQINDEIWAMWAFSRAHGQFLVKGQPPGRPPDWILLQESPLPSGTQPEIASFLDSGEYDFAWQFSAVTLDRGERIYDLQDAFFVPFAGFDGVIRPGPNFTMYRRRVPLFR